MIFEYEELRECVQEDFDTFYKEMNFTELQVIPAILNEYEHGEGFTITEKVCIYLFLGEIFLQKKLSIDEINKKLSELLTQENLEIIKNDLSENFINFTDDLKKIK